MNAPPDFVSSLRGLIDPIASLVSTLRTASEGASVELQAIHPVHHDSALNLVQYLALRRHDVRELQDRLAEVGLSSLGRAESCVGATLENVLELLVRATGEPQPARRLSQPTLAQGQRLLERNTQALLGPPHGTRRVRILVTLPSEAADDPGLVRTLLQRGMDVARINCAHDDAEAWLRMITHVRRESLELGVPCHVLMDLAGPKLRTGSLVAGPEVCKIKPTRDALGRVTDPALVWLGLRGALRPTSAEAVLYVDAPWLARLEAGGRIHLTDARGSKRTWRVREVGKDGALVEVSDTTYVQSGTRLAARHEETTIEDLPAVEAPLLLRPGDRLVVTRGDRLGSAGPTPEIPCTLPEVFADVKVGQPIWFDDGTIGGRIVEVAREQFTVEITDAKPTGSALRSDKGINLPETVLRLPALNAKDEEDLRFVAAHADLVGYSFVRRPSDVVSLHEHLTALGRPDLGVLLKIETRDAFENLPQLLLAAMRRPKVGVMIARGDLAVECGWERLAEIQEEILWICEAAHLPVVWATQVLEQLAKLGRPSRAEITDAAMSERAECVMLNKGPHLPEAVAVLDDILRRMERHQLKKRAMLRPLALAERFSRG